MTSLHDDEAADAVEAVHRHFARAPRLCIALHDIGGEAGIGLLTALARGAEPQRELVPGRNGHAGPASLPYTELPRGLRLYASDARAPAAPLLAHSRLGVLLIGTSSLEVIEKALQPLREAMRERERWPNRALLLVPMVPTPPLATLASALAGRTGVEVRVTPTAPGRDAAWRYVSGAWNRLRDQGGESPPPVPRPAAAAPSATDDDSAPEDPVWATWLGSCLALNGLLHGCVFSRQPLRLLAVHGSPQAGERLGRQGAALADAVGTAGSQLGLDPAAPDMAITLGGHHLLLAALPGRKGHFVHLMLDARQANLPLARLQLGRLVAAAPQR